MMYILTLLFLLVSHAWADELNQSEREMRTLYRYPAPENATASIILLHGVTSNSTRFLPMVDVFHSQERFRHINFILPNAPVRAMGMFSNPFNHSAPNMALPSWFNISQGGLENGYDEDQYWEISDYISRLIKNETEVYGIPPDRIVAGGHSQGGMVSLGAIASIDTKIAGWLLFPTEIPQNLTQFNSRLNNANHDTPIFHGHGLNDTVIPVREGIRTANLFKSLGYNYTLKLYPGMIHQSDFPQNDADANEWVAKIIPKI